MKVLVVGNASIIEEFKLKFISSEDISKNSVDTVEKQDNHDFIFIYDYSQLNDELLHNVTIVFDFFLDESIDNLEYYKEVENLIIFGNLLKTTLAETWYYHGRNSQKVFGLNGMNGMINRKYLEVSVFEKGDKGILEQVCTALGTEFLIVDDRVGMVTPRIICMIINEAFFTVQEGTANKDDIDIAMKLGTQHPYGPFEWCDKFGTKNIYELLEAIYEDTKDDRYKICSLLKKEYLRIS